LYHTRDVLVKGRTILSVEIFIGDLRTVSTAVGKRGYHITTFPTFLPSTASLHFSIAPCLTTCL
jgi:hypothetical protein